MITSFIDDLDSLKTHHPEMIAKVKNISMLKDGLHKLDEVVGMHTFKGEVIRTIKDFLQTEDFKDNRLHCVISGSPGCGKTTLAKILAQIYYSVGVMKDNPKRQTLVYRTTQSIPLWVFLITGLIVGLFIYQYLSLKWTLISLAILWVYAIIILLVNAAIDGMNINSRKTVVELPKEDQYFIMVKRDQLVSRWLGNSAHDTKMTLQKCVDKVVFIDEAYSLINSMHSDPYGQEACNVLIDWMDEYRGRCVVIFGGYEEKMNATIFKAQPGLKSRCHKVFHIDEYSHEDIFRIFEGQLRKKNLILTDYEHERQEIIDLFKVHRDLFPYSGRDTERLVTYIKEIYNSRVFDSKVKGTQPPSDKIKSNIIGQGLNQLASSQRTYVPKNPLQDLIDELS